MGHIGVAAVEDDGIYFAVIEADGAGLHGIEPLPPTPRPKDGYSGCFIVNAIREHFGKMVANATISGVGVSMFGLIDLDEKTLLQVPRYDWSTSEPSVPLDFRTLFAGLPPERVFVGHDSSTAAVGEWWMMKRQPGFEASAFVRIRVGAGIGVGCVNRNGTVRAGRSHPEAGHLPVMRREGDRRGTCRAHSGERWDCIEGVMSEKAILARCGARRLIDIPSNHVVWNTAAEYLAQLCVAITTLIAPDIIVIGGRTMIEGNERLRRPVMKKIRDAFKAMIGDYPRYEKMKTEDRYIQGSLAVPNPATASLIGVAELARRDFFRVIEGELPYAPNVHGGDSRGC